MLLIGRTFEVIQPDTSEENNAVKKVIEKIVQLLQVYDNFISVEIKLLRIPNDIELNLIEKECSVLFAQTKKTELEMAGLGLIKINCNDSIVYSPFQYEGFNDTSVLAQMNTMTEANPEGVSGLKKLISCRIAVSDERARRFLIDASEQLSTTSSNLIWIDGRFVIGLKRWPVLIADQFKKNLD